MAGNPLVPHDTWSGKQITLKGTSDVQGANIQYTWDFGDGSPVVNGTVADQYVIEMDYDERFVGDVGWRQNHQSFDALRVDNSSLGGLRFTYIFVDRVNRVFGDSLEFTGHLLNTSFDLQNFGKFTLYGYLLDYRDAATAEQSTSTWGLELAGRRRLTFRTEALYEIEHAEQSDYADNPRAVDAGYSSLMIGVGLRRANLRLAWEQLDGSPADGRFTTPLATLHEWNGWADRFLETPTDGLEDLYLQVDGEVGPLAWLVRYHDFGAQSAGVGDL